MNNKQAYYLITGIIFSIIAVLHLLRIINGWGAMIGQCKIPLWGSWLGFGLAGFLSFWAFQFFNKKQ